MRGARATCRAWDLRAIAPPPFPRRRPDARLAQLVGRVALNLVVVGSDPTVGGSCCWLRGRPARPSGQRITAWRGVIARWPAQKHAAPADEEAGRRTA